MENTKIDPWVKVINMFESWNRVSDTIGDMAASKSIGSPDDLEYFDGYADALRENSYQAIRALNEARVEFATQFAEAVDEEIKRRRREWDADE